MNDIKRVQKVTIIEPGQLLRNDLCQEEPVNSVQLLLFLLAHLESA